MKFKIIERNDGMFEVYEKKFFLFPWEDSCYGPFAKRERAKEYINEKINRRKLTDLERYGRKHKRVIEVISE
jgi:hypothetical protein